MDTSPHTIQELLSEGDDLEGHRSGVMARSLLGDFKKGLGLPQAPDHGLDPLLEAFIGDVILGAAWYQKRYLGAQRKVYVYIVINIVAIIGFPIALMGLWKLGHWWNIDGRSGQITSQLVGVLSGILGLQKTLSTWYATQQRFAIWFKSASDLKTIYYALLQTWAQKIPSNPGGFRMALASGSAAARKVINDEELDFYQKLALPSFDVLDMLTSTRSAASTLATSLLPGTPARTITAVGKSAMLSGGPLAAPRPLALLQPIAPPVLDDFVLVPGGRRHRGNVRRIASGTRFSFRDRAAARMRQRIAPGPPDAANWIASAWWRNDTGEPIRSFVTTWVVPPDPATSAAQLLYFFSGLEPADGSSILQPVLQWGDYGPDADGLDRTGPFWTIASWLVGGPDDTANHTPHVRVNPGDVLTGVIRLVSTTGAGYVYTCEFQGIEGTTLTTPPLPELVWCVEVLEAYELTGVHSVPYDLESVSEYPNAPAITFAAIGITTDAPGPAGHWSAVNTVTQYGEACTIAADSSTNGQVEISFGRPGP